MIFSQACNSLSYVLSKSQTNLRRLQGYLPGLFGVSHGALQFMAYEELKKLRSSYFGTPIDRKLVRYRNFRCWLRYSCVIFALQTLIYFSALYDICFPLYDRLSTKPSR